MTDPNEGLIFKIGNLVRDPEMRFGQNGQAICEVDLAVNSPKDSDEPTQFYRLVMFRSLAENACDSLEKATRVVVVGRPDIDEWTDRESGESRTRKKIIVVAIGADLRNATTVVTRVYRAVAPSPSKVDVTTF